MSKSSRRRQAQTNPPANEMESPAPLETISVSNNGDTAVLQPVQVAVPPPNAMTLRSLGDVFTLEVVAYFAIGVVALLLRIVNLDARPLAPEEAQTAAAAFEFLNGQPVGAYTSPFLFTLDWVAFLLFGAFDLTARVLPAALSTLLVFIPALARTAVGKTGAVVASLLIALSPTLVFFARSLSAAELAVGAALSAVLLVWNYSRTQNRRALYAAAFLAGLSITADAAAFTVLGVGAVYFGISFLLARGKAAESGNEAAALTSAAQNPLVRAAAVFAGTYILFSTTFLLNRDGLGIGFNLLGTWLGSFSTLGNFASPMVWLLVYEPLPLIFGIAGLVLALTARGEGDESIGLLRLVSVIALAVFFLYTLAGEKSPSVIAALSLPLILLAGWFIGNLIARAAEDIKQGTDEGAGWHSTLAGEIPIFVMLMILSALVYLQAVTFLQQSRFSPALDALYNVFAPNASEVSLGAAAATLAIISLLLLGVFVGLSILLVGIARTTTLLAFAILVILSLGTLRSLWLLNYSGSEPLRELVAASQTPLQMRDLVRDLQFYSQARNGDSHVIRVAADPALGASGRWYLRGFPNQTWSTSFELQQNAQAIVTSSGGPPPGNWMGQQYRTGLAWQPEGFEGLGLWKWYLFREGGTEAWQSAMLWLPTESE